jgi:phosphonoacetaldehyde hydrolase
MKKIQAVIMDWAGTTVDFGSNAPVEAFMKAFGAFGVFPTVAEIREFMGMDKREHVKKMLEFPRISEQWRKTHGCEHTDEDADAVYEKFEPALYAVLEDRADPLPGVLETVRSLREIGITIGSTTGYTRAMMEVVARHAREEGYAPDCLVCPEDVGRGRPYPYMIWRNLEYLGVRSVSEAVKVGDTAADMREGRNAGCRCVGVIRGSSVLGLGEDELAVLGAKEADALFSAARSRYYEAGANYVINDISFLPGLIEFMNTRNNGAKPNGNIASERGENFE